MRENDLKKILILIAVVLIIIAAIAGKFIWPSSSSAVSNEKKPLYWIDTMEPTIHYPKPGKSRMGMELVPVYPDDASNQSNIRISPAIINNLGVRTVIVTKRTITRRIETVGSIEPDETKISNIHSYADGWVKKLFVNTVGQKVKKDQILLQLYSPTLILAQQEYLLALNSSESSTDQNLVDGSIKKMQALHISDRQIQQLKQTKEAQQLVDIEAPQDGIVEALNVREGTRITPDTQMISLVDLSTVWVIAQIFEEQSNWVSLGEVAEAKLSAFPEKVWKGQVEYIYPEVDPITRTLKVRVVFDNPDQSLKPNMYANITIMAAPKNNVLIIPLEALIRSSQGNRVIVSLGNGRFEVRPIITGIESGDQVEVISGLGVDEHIVVSGQFLIDSEANLKVGLQRIESEPNATSSDNTSSWSNIIIEGKGIIQAINIPQNIVTLQHQPIPELSWPEMAMEFSIEKNIDLNKFKIGDRVKFTFKKSDENIYTITNMEKLQ